MQGLDENLEDQAKREAAALSTIWFALLLSIGAYVVVGSMFAGARETASLQRAVVSVGNLEVALSAVRVVFIVAALGMLVAAGWVARTLLADDAVVASAAGAAGEDRLRTGFAYLRKHSFVAWGLAEGVILLGTLLAVMSGRPFELLPFAVAGATSLFLLKPEAPSLLELAGKMAAGKLF